ncbi:ribonuclease HIII [Pontiella sulfatireligans]|uniref:Ribonuclease n=1 Tax=Pontiella sulfatireligans TaxID=2750658 RepID=A0A6C2UN48_9BACT|nr:ribonuclease HIII [Pontiella sulfatireligans]VGO21363.1 Ribonuclease HIII [Pontiella sulfatireligans]
MNKNSFTFKLDEQQQQAISDLLKNRNYIPAQVPHTRVAVSIPDCRINLYNSGKLLVQGKAAKEWIEFTLEPEILKEAAFGCDEIDDPEAFQPHMGIDESGKGDFFGPLVIASAYVDENLVEKLRAIGVRDSKKITSDNVSLAMARDIKKILGDRCAMVTIGPRSYNRMYAKIKNVNKMLAWGHARAIENLLEKVPECPRALSDKFGPTHQIERALMDKGKKIKLDQRTKAESDPAVAAASVLARAGFLYALKAMGKEHGFEVPKGASEKVRREAEKLVAYKGPGILLDTAKCHFQTTDKVLAEVGYTRKDLPSPF